MSEARKLRSALIGLEHVHTRMLANDFSKHDEIEWVGMAELPGFSEEAIQKHIKKNVGTDLEIPFWEDYKELLKQNLNLILVNSSVQGHTQIVEEALALGIHVVVEKPMALTMEDARRMYRAYKKSTAHLIINWPIAWFPTFRKAKELADSGVIGDILRVQYRSPSTIGPFKPGEYTPQELADWWWFQHEKGGGSICDYAGYGCVLTAWITGKKAKRVSGLKKNFLVPFSDVEDYSVFTIDFGDSVGLIEGSWSTMSNGQIPTGPVVYGSKGVIVADRFDPAVKVYTDFIPYRPTPEPNEVYVMGPIEDNLAANVIHFLLDGEPLFEMITPEFNMRAQAILDAGRRSCESGQIEYAEEPLQF